MSDTSDGIVRTYRTGPSDPVVFADGPGTAVETWIDASPAAVWPFVVDIDLLAQFSDEYLGGQWTGDGPALRATFIGRNKNDFIGEWEIESFIDVFEEHAAFGWATADPADPGARWCFRLEPSNGGTTVRYEVSLGPGFSGVVVAIMSMPDKEAMVIRGRINGLNANMERTVAGLKALVES